MKNAILFAALIMASLANFAYASSSLSDDVTSYLYGMKGVYGAQYAPAEWKQKYAGYNLDQEFAKAIAAVQGNPNFDLSDARRVLINFVYAMRDYHTSIQFVSTENASLPFVVHGTSDRFFILAIDRTKLPESSFPFQVGDELVTFGGQPTADAVALVQNQFIENTAATDKALAEIYLTNRSATRGLIVPKGPIVVGVKRKGSDKVTMHELIWDYTPEKVAPRSPTLEFANGVATDGQQKPSSALHPMMTVMAEKLDGSYGLGARQTFTPDLGTKVWESAADNSFYAYTYMTPDRKLIGYIRIAGYIMPDYNKAIADFAKIIKLFEATTDSMVIDQVNNPGGSVFYLYALASMLTDQPLHTPLHHMSVTQADVMGALQIKERFKDVKNDEDAKKAAQGEADDDGWPVNYEFAKFSVAYADFIVDQWTQGHRVTEPYWIGGVNQINPAATHYTKPILLLTNHLDFSGGDFFPAILQDNQRVKIFGSRTAGAGGYVLEANYANNIDVLAYRITGSIAARLSGNPIENLGIMPDYEYEMTAEDYQSDYAPYVKAIQTTVNELTK